MTLTQFATFLLLKEHTGGYTTINIALDLTLKLHETEIEVVLRPLAIRKQRLPYMYGSLYIFITYSRYTEPKGGKTVEVVFREKLNSSTPASE